MDKHIFRIVDRNLCIINDTDETKQMLTNYAPDFNDIDETNSLLCVAYIDTQNGLTYEVLAATYYEDGDYTVVYEFAKDEIKIRSDAIYKEKVTPIKNKALNKRFANKIDGIKQFYSNLDVIKSREIQDIDQFRHEIFPDDVVAYIFKEDMNPESIWIRLEKYVGEGKNIKIFQGKLLNEPYNDFGVHCNDIVTLLSGKTEKGEQILFVNLPDM